MGKRSIVQQPLRNTLNEAKRRLSQGEGTLLHAIRITKRDQFRLFLSDVQFDLFWWLVMVLHGVLGMFLIGNTVLYFWLFNTKAIEEQLLMNLTFSVSYRVLRRLIWWFAALAMAHFFFIGQNCLASCKKHQLFFSPSEPSRSSTTLSNPAPRVLIQRQWLENSNESSAATTMASRTASGPMFPVSTLHEHRFVASVVGCLGKCYSWYEHFMGNWVEPIFYIHGEYFDDYFLVQEVVEVSSQIYQAYQMSVYIATRWINHLFVGMIVLNCMSTPIILWLLPNAELPVRRMITVTTSMLLNAMNSVVIPVVIFQKYWRAYDPELQNFPLDLLLDDVWYVKAVRENQQLLVTSIVDFFATLTPHWGMLSDLWTCESMVCRGAASRDLPSFKSASSFKSRKSTLVKVMPTLSISSNMSPSMSDTGLLTNDLVPTKPTMGRRHGKKTKVVLLETFLWIAGVATLVIHILAQYVHEVDGCKLHATPWLNQRTSCVVMNVNCYRRTITGTQQQLDEIFDQLHKLTLLALIITHCPALSIPPSLREFHHLVSIEIYNSSVHEWNATASLREQDFGYLSYVYFIRSNVSQVPEGLLDQTFPRSVQEVRFYSSNLSEIPANVNDIWITPLILDFEFSRFEAFPSAMFKMRSPMQIIIFTGNPLRIFGANPDNADNASETTVFENPGLLALSLSGTQLTTLPSETMGNIDDMANLALEYTQVSEVPSYIRVWYDAMVRDERMVFHSLFGSPYCNKTLDTQEEQVYQSQVCAQDLLSAQGQYPIDYMAAQRQP